MVTSRTKIGQGGVRMRRLKGREGMKKKQKSIQTMKIVQREEKNRKGNTIGRGEISGTLDAKKEKKQKPRRKKDKRGGANLSERGKGHYTWKSTLGKRKRN